MELRLVRGTCQLRWVLELAFAFEPLEKVANKGDFDPISRLRRCLEYILTWLQMGRSLAGSQWSSGVTLFPSTKNGAFAFLK